MVFHNFISTCKKIRFFSLYILFAYLFFASAGYAETFSPKKVKIGWYKSDLFQNGVSDDETKSGYCYEYLHKVASYNGWEYKYIYGEWPELLEKLRRGEIDIMAGVSITQDRLPYISFPNHSMGTDLYYLYQHESNKSMNASDLTSFHGQTIGTVKDNMMSYFLEKWIEEKGVDLKIIYFDGFTDRDKAFADNQIDGIVATDNNILNDTGYSLVTKVGADPYYLAVTKSRSDLLSELNYALELMDQMDPYFLQNLQYASYKNTVTSTTMTELETQWLKENDTLSIGYISNYIPYCFTDKNGNVSGLITDVVNASVDALGIKNQLTVRYRKYGNYDDMILALTNGEIDAAFPVGGSGWNLEKDGIDASNTVVSAGMDLVYKGKYQKNDSGTFAVNKNNKLQYYFIKNNFPDAEFTEYNSINDCIDAVYNGEADFTVLNGLRIELIRNDNKYNTLSVMQLQKTDNRYIGVKHGNVALLLLINRGLRLLGSDYGSNASYSYIDQNKVVTFRDYVRNHLLEIFLIFIGVIILLFILFLLYIKGIKKAQKETNLQLEKNRELTTQLEKKNTELETLNLKLIKAKEEAESANRSKTDFLNNMSHDIRTPMNAILGFAKLMENKLNDSELLAQYLRKMQSSGEYLLEIINNVLDVARIDSGKVTVDENFVDLTAPDCSVYPLLENEFNKNNLHFTCSMNISHRYVFTDMPKIREINMNIMSNAIKYTPEGGRIHLQFEEVPCHKEGYACYINTISDTGIGMSEEFQKKIFDSFTRERNSTESKVMGTGLGMTIVKHLVDLLGGTIEVESKIGQGTTFKVTMVHKIVDDPEIYLKKQKKSIKKDNNLSGKRILLAEDNELNAEIAVAILEEAGILVDVAEDGIVCIDKFGKAEQGYYDLILMDIQMPNLNGYETTEKIRNSGSNIPIIAMTANAFEEDRQNVLKAGMNGFVTKPIDVKKLMETLSEVLK